MIHTPSDWNDDTIRYSANIEVESSLGISRRVSFSAITVCHNGEASKLKHMSEVLDAKLRTVLGLG